VCSALQERLSGATDCKAASLRQSLLKTFVTKIEVDAESTKLRVTYLTRERISGAKRHKTGTFQARICSARYGGANRGHTI